MIGAVQVFCGRTTEVLFFPQRRPHVTVGIHELPVVCAVIELIQYAPQAT